MRGKGQTITGNGLHTGITPACAGKRSELDTSIIDEKDHPRMCGEKIPGWYSLLVTVGSPPHVRGKVTAYIEHIGQQGITPACAGKRQVDWTGAANHEDHPRMCGEKVILLT